MKRRSENKGSLIVVLVAIIGIAVFYFLGWPAIQDLKVTNEELAVAQADLTAGKQYISDIRSAYGKIKALEGQLDILNVAAPAEPDIPEALVQINAIVNKNSLSMESVVPTEASDGSFKIGLVVNGDYAQLKQCLVDFEKNLRPIQINEISIARSEDEEAGVTTTGSYSISMSYVNPTSTADTMAADSAVSEGGTGEE